ncbi:hypothetical protein DRN67_00725 [Candidatus Micrarchaeota archaeon]|nr:MAG: hypothetical protein DRN67_00725 [Candidatus Micrarchaeota archaeon]
MKEVKTLDEALIDLISKANPDGVKSALEKGADPAAKTRNGSVYALEFAKHNLDELRNTLAVKDDTGVMAAAERAETIIVMIQEALDNELNKVAAGGMEDVARAGKLVEAGADLNARDAGGISVLEHAIMMANALTVAELINNRGARVTEKTAEFAGECKKLLSDKTEHRGWILNFITRNVETGGNQGRKVRVVKENALGTNANGNDGRKPGPTLKS